MTTNDGQGYLVRTSYEPAGAGPCHIILMMAQMARHSDIANRQTSMSAITWHQPSHAEQHNHEPCSTDRAEIGSHHLNRHLDCSPLIIVATLAGRSRLSGHNVVRRICYTDSARGPPGGHLSAVSTRGQVQIDSSRGQYTRRRTCRAVPQTQTTTRSWPTTHCTSVKAGESPCSRCLLSAQATCSSTFM